MPRDPTLNRGVEFSVPFPDFQGGERCSRLNPSPIANGLIDHAYVIKFPLKTQRKVFRELPG